MFNFCSVIHAHVLPYFIENTLPLPSVVNFGIEVLSLDLNILLHFLVDDNEPLVVLTPLNEENISDVPMEETGEIEIEREKEAMDETESEVEVVKLTLGTRISQGRKRTRSSTKVQTTPGPSTKKAKEKAIVSSSLKAKKANNIPFLFQRGRAQNEAICV